MQFCLHFSDLSSIYMRQPLNCMYAKSPTSADRHFLLRIQCIMLTDDAHMCQCEPVCQVDRIIMWKRIYVVLIIISVQTPKTHLAAKTKPKNTKRMPEYQ